MQYFVRKSSEWLAYVMLTTLFFSLPILLRSTGSENAIRTGGERQGQVETLLFEFLPASAERSVEGDSTGLKMIARTDTSDKTVYLYVNGEKQDMAVVSGSTEVEFPRVYLNEGENEIIAVLRSLRGDTVAVRRMRIVSQKKL